MKVVLRSSSLVFTLLSIVLNAPISRVKRPAENPDQDPAPIDRVPDEAPRVVSESVGRLAPDNYQLIPRPRA